MKKTKVLFALAIGFAMAVSSCKPSDENVLKEENSVISNSNSTIPYSVQLVEYINPLLPNLHSFTYGIYGDKIILIGGRRKGLHSVNYSFTQNAANKIIYVIDTYSWTTAANTWSVYSRADSLTVPVSSITCNNGVSNAGQFRANNAEFFTNGNTLYIIGGLVGAATTNTNSIQSLPFTLPYMTAVNMGALVSAVMSGSTAASRAVYQTENPRLAITGGEVSASNNTVTMAFGWNVYGQIGGLYSHQISTFTYTDTGNSLAIGNYTFCPTCNDAVQTGTTGLVDSIGNGGSFRRRDGSMSPIIDPKSDSVALMFYAGVFKNGNTNFTTPIWIRNNSASEVNSFDMRGNVYTCKVLPVYSKQRKEFYATMLGGMTNSTYSFAATSTVTNAPNVTPSVTTLLSNLNSTITTPDPNNFLSVPFFNGITTLKIDGNQNLSQYMMNTTFPATSATMALPTVASGNYPSPYILPPGSIPFNGAEAELFWNFNSNFNYKGSGVIDFDSMFNGSNAPVTVGYLFGGLLSVVDNVNMNNTSNNQERLTVASNRLFAIQLVPNN